MTLQVLTSDAPRTIRLIGEVDVSNAHRLRDALGEELHRGGDIVVDLAGLAFLDSTGIQLLIRTALSLRGRGRLRLVSPGDLVRRTLELIPVGKLDNVEVVDEP
jgi:anti-sigma B factor antagonist